MPFIIGTAGHIDHGKTSLIKALTGMDTDRLKEEKERGISIDLGFAYLDLPNPPSPPFDKGGKGGFTRCGIVDVPGHERFIKNMLTGATGIDMVLFVVAADDGIMPQTREHLDIMHLLGIRNGIFVITKIDLVDDRQVTKVSKDIKDLIKGTLLRDSSILPISSVTGSGIDDLKRLIIEQVSKVKPRPEGGYFRLPIDRSFSIKGFGTVVTGTVISGSIQKNADAIIISNKADNPQKAKIRGMQSHFKEVTTITTGQRAAINLSGITHTDIERGDMLASTDLDRIGDTVDVSFEFLDSIKRHMKNYSVFKLHHLTDETLAKIFFADIHEAGPGVKAFGQVRLKKPMALMRGDRFILRDTSINATIGGGTALLPYAKKGKVLDKGQYKVLGGQDLKLILSTLLSDKDTWGIDVHTIRLMLNITEKELKELINSNEAVVSISGQLFLKERIKEIEKGIVETLAKYHMHRPGDIGADEDYIIKGAGGKGLGAGIKSEILKTILNVLISSGRILRTGNIFHLPSHKPQTTGKEKEIEDALISIFSDKGFNPLRMDEMLHLSYKKEDIKNVLQLLIKRGMIVRVTEDSFATKSVLDEAREKLVGWIATKGKIKAAEFRDIIGCGRKFAIELLEYFDKEKITLRNGDYRVLRKAVGPMQ